MEVDGKPGVVSRRNNRGCQRPQREGEAYLSHGASLPDPDKLFNASLDGNARRAIDFFGGDKINERALKNLVRTAVDYNQVKLKKKAPAGTRARSKKA
jgi:hypothetical protein